eukprot:2742303-Amphidinium_carterae.1
MGWHLAPTQSDTSGEIYAAVFVMEHSDGHVRISTDCLTLVRGLREATGADDERESPDQMWTWHPWKGNASADAWANSGLHIDPTVAADACYNANPVPPLDWHWSN